VREKRGRCDGQRQQHRPSCVRVERIGKRGREYDRVVCVLLFSPGNINLFGLSLQSHCAAVNQSGTSTVLTVSAEAEQNFHPCLTPCYLHGAWRIINFTNMTVAFNDLRESTLSVCQLYTLNYL
jgi:hypothetical protein